MNRAQSVALLKDVSIPLALGDLAFRLIEKGKKS